MNTNQIECFVRSSKCLSFTSAASELFLSPQAVSKQVIALEDELGMRLFDRNGPRLRLTEAGKQFYTMFQSLNRQLTFMTEDVQQYLCRQKLSLSVGVSEWLDPAGEFMEGINRFRENTPCKVSVGVYPNAELQEALNAGTVDCAIYSGGQAPLTAEYESCVIATEEMCLYTPRTTGEGKAREDCWGLPLLWVSAWSRSSSEMRILGAKEITGIRLSPKTIYQLPNVQSLYVQMEYGRGVTLGGSRFSYLSKIPSLIGHPTGATDETYCLWSRRNRNSPAEELARTLRDVFRCEK